MRKIKKILFLGNFSVDYCTEVHHAKTYEKLGIEVIRMQEGKVSGYQILERLEQGDIDAFSWTHTHGWATEGIENALDYCNRSDIPSYGYHLDLWLGIQRQKDLDTDQFWKVNYFFSVDPEMVDLLNSKDNMPKAFFLPAGVFEDECYMAEPNRERYPHEIIFVGSYGYHPEWPYRPQLIDWLKATYGDRFAQYGGGGLPTIRGHKLNVLYASAKVVVGDTLCPGFSKPGYLSDRIFETTGRGGMIIHPRIEGMKDMFKFSEYKDEIWSNTSEIITYEFNDFKELEYKIDQALRVSNDTCVRLYGHERTKKDHTYTQRLTKLISILENV